MTAAPRGHYPPGDVKLNGERYPQEIAGDLGNPWAHRDRLLQSDALIDLRQPSVGPEPGTTYAVELYDAASSTLRETGISTTTAVVPSTFASDNRLELYSVRDEQQSWQRQVLRFRSSLEILGLLPGTANLESYRTAVCKPYGRSSLGSSRRAALGLHLDPASGLIGGVAQDTPGYYSVELRVVVDGLIARKTFTIGLNVIYASLLHLLTTPTIASAFVDQTGKAWTRSGSSPVIKTDVAKVGSASLRLSGNNDYVQTRTTMTLTLAAATGRSGAKPFTEHLHSHTQPFFRVAMAGV